MFEFMCGSLGWKVLSKSRTFSVFVKKEDDKHFCILE